MHMPLYITVDNRFEAKPAEENYKSNVMYAKYNGNHQSCVKLKKAEQHYSCGNKSLSKQAKIKLKFLKQQWSQDHSFFPTFVKYLKSMALHDDGI